MEVAGVPIIRPVSDLRSYNDVLRSCRVGEPVFLTKNGRGRYVLLDIEEYERQRAVMKLLSKLSEAECVAKTGDGWRALDDLKIVLELG